jgi:4-hydroxybenzoyl-CoA reductase subunit beta
MGTIGGNVCVDTRCTYYNQTEEWRRSIDYCMKEEGDLLGRPELAALLGPLGVGLRAHAGRPGRPGALVSAEGERTVPVEGLYRDDGIDYLAKRPDEIVAAIRLPRRGGRGALPLLLLEAPPPRLDRLRGAVGGGGGVDRRRRHGDRRPRSVLGAVASQPVSADETAEALVGGKLDAETIAHAASLARRHATPMDNTDFQAQWRGAVVPRYVEAALRECAGLPTERLAPRH